MTLDQIHALARKYDLKTRPAVVFGPIAVAANAFILGQLWQTFPDALSRTGIVLLAAGMLFCCYVTYSFVFPRRDPAEPAGAYLHRQLRRSLRNARGGWLISLAALLPGMAVLQAAQAARHTHGPWWAPVLPLALLVLALGFFVVKTRRGARRLKQDLDELDRLLQS